jgi:hypothetical protein
VIPAAYGVEVIDHLLDEFDTLVLLKVKPLVDEVIELLEQRDLLATSCFIEKVGAPDERVVRDVASLQGREGQLPVADAGAEPQARARRTAARLPQAPRKSFPPIPCGIPLPLRGGSNGMTKKQPDAPQPCPRPPMKIAVVSITRHGIALAGKVVAACPAPSCSPRKIPCRGRNRAATRRAAHCYEGKVGDQVPALFAAFDGIVAIVSLGAVVRLIAPHLASKETDPAVVVIDEAGKFVIPVLSGHLGGANALAGISPRRSAPRRC